jgi:hypothetical protein
MGHTIRDLKEARAWHERHEAAAPKPGDLAPDFSLADADGGSRVRLSDLRGKRPVALVFGSVT